MKEGLTFVWLVWFTALHLGGSNGGTDFENRIHLPVSTFDSNSKTASDWEEFTSATSDFIEQHSTVLCQGTLWKSNHFSVSFFVFLMSPFARGLYIEPKSLYIEPI